MVKRDVKSRSRKFWSGLIHSVEISRFFFHSDLREINFGDSWCANCAILAHLEALNFIFYEFLHFLHAEKYQINRI